MMKKTAEKAGPSRVFAIKMRYRIYKKGFVLYFTGPQARMHFAGATLVVVLFFGGGVGTYAYASPDVNVQHPLYPVKQGLEAVEGGFAFAPDQKAEFFMKKASRRMEEAETLHHKLQQRLDMAQDAEAVQATLEMISAEMEESFRLAEGEFDAEKAEGMVGRMEERCGKIRDRLEGLPPLENGRPHISALHIKMQNLDENTLEKLNTLREVHESVAKARKGKEKRVMLKFMIPPPPPGIVPPPGIEPASQPSVMSRKAPSDGVPVGL